MNENRNNVTDVVNFILGSKLEKFSRERLCTQFGLNERQIRQAFYNIKDMGLYVLNEGDIYFISRSEQVDERYHEIQRQLKSDYRKAMKLIKRVHKQNKALPQKYQIPFHE